jgi:CrcB protein
LLGGWVASRLGVEFSYRTYVINVTGSFILGFFLAFSQDRLWVAPPVRLLFAVGFVGAYTTFSTFEYESIRLLQGGELLLGATYLI